MKTRLVPYGSKDTRDVAKVGKKQTPSSLMRRMPSPEVAAKVGESTVGQVMDRPGVRTHRVIRRGAKVQV